MSQKRFIGLLMIAALAALALCGLQVFRRASASKLSISFVGYGGSGEEQFATFRITNSSPHAYAFLGEMPGVPYRYWYRVAAGGQWHDRVPEKPAAQLAWQTFAPRSYLEFTIPVPTAKNTSRFGRVLWEVPNFSAPPPAGAAFTVVLHFLPGDGGTVQADWVSKRMPFTDKIRLDTVRLIRKGYSYVGFDGDRVDRQLKDFEYGRGEWIVSTPAPVQ